MIESIEVIKQSAVLMFFAPFVAVWIGMILMSLLRLYLAK